MNPHRGSTIIEELPARFVRSRALGSGGFGHVYEVHDAQRDVRVALKTLHDLSPQALYRFKQEFRALADLAHPNLISLYELLSFGERWFFTMELVEGVDFLAWVRGAEPAEAAGAAATLDLSSPALATRSGAVPVPSRLQVVERDDGPLSVELPLYDEARLRASLIQLVAGINALHQAGKLHRDIKPSNVLVTAQGRVVLLDFGLVTELDEAPRVNANEEVQFIGTPQYMSPEQAMGMPSHQAADWYSVGVMLYEALTGRRPVEGRTPLQILLKKQQSEPRDVRALSPEVPEDLAELCMALLSRAPEARPDGRAIAAHLGGARQLGRVSLSARHAEVPFVGRHDALIAMRAALDALLQRGLSGFVNVLGVSGMGKTALVRRFLREHAPSRGDVLIFEGRCYENESLPYKALDSLLDALTRHLERLPRAQQLALGPPDGGALTLIFPALRRVEAWQDVCAQHHRLPNDSQQARRRAFEALRHLLGRLAEQQPLVLFVDDIQWGDEDSALLLEHLLRPPDAPRMLLITTCRAEDAASSAFAQRLYTLQHNVRESTTLTQLSVGELSAGEAQELVVALLGSATQEAAPLHVTHVAREARGNPLFIDELARYIQVMGDRPDSDVTGLDEVLAARVAKLPEHARVMLEVISVCGQPTARAVIRRVASLDDQEPALLSLLRKELLIRQSVQRAGEPLETYHDRVREAVASRLAPTRKRQIHLDLARALLEQRGLDPEVIGQHFIQGGAPEHAITHLLRAAKQAHQALAFERAARLYAQLLSLRPWSASERLELRRQLGLLLGYLGRGAEAATHYLAAVQDAPPAQAPRLQHQAADQLMRAGRHAQGMAILEELLQHVGAPKARQGAALMTQLVAQRAKLSWRGMHFKETPHSALDPQVRWRLELCWSAAQLVSAIDLRQGAYFATLHLLYALEAGEPTHLSLALALESIHLAGTPKHRARAATMLQSAQALVARSADAPYCEGFCCFAQGMQAFLSGAWTEALAPWKRAEQLLERQCQGVAWELAGARFYPLMVYEARGDLQQLCALAPSQLEEAQARQDLLYATNYGLWSHVAHLAQHQPERGLRSIDQALSRWPAQGYLLQNFWHLLATVQCALYAGDAPTAWALLERDWTPLQRSFLPQSMDLVACLSIDMRARAALAMSLRAPEGSRERKQLERVVSQCAQQLDANPMPMAAACAHALRAQLAHQRGDHVSALSALGEAERLFIREQMMLRAMSAHLVAGLLCDDPDPPIAHASAWMTRQGIKHPMGFAQMYFPIARTILPRDYGLATDDP